MDSQLERLPGNGSFVIVDHCALAPKPQQRSRSILSELYSENITAKVVRTAIRHLKNNNPPSRYPELVPQTGEDAGIYQQRDIDFWTCGFFPGCIYSLLERIIRYPKSIQSDTRNGGDLVALRKRLEVLGQIWSDPIHGESRLTNTHDMGFIMMPHMRPRWELYHDDAALDSILTSAKNLATRFSPVVQAIRSWDEVIWDLVTEGKGKPGNYIVIIDSMCNLELLFYAARHAGLEYLADVATRHALTVLRTHLRHEGTYSMGGCTNFMYSTRHVINFCPNSGVVQENLTAQGFSATSTWSRGQAWAILGFVQTYVWTGRPEFLDAACGLAEYFLFQMETAPACVEVAKSGANRRRIGRYVPVWDFTAPIEPPGPPLRDSSAGTCAANGMLILAHTLAAQGKHEMSSRYLDGALNVIEDTLEYSLSEERAQLSLGPSGELIGTDVEEAKTFEAILKNATASNNPASTRKAKDHGLVYGDYYLIEFGTNLLRLGLTIDM